MWTSLHKQRFNFWWLLTLACNHFDFKSLFFDCLISISGFTKKDKCSWDEAVPSETFQFLPRGVPVQEAVCSSLFLLSLWIWVCDSIVYHLIFCVWFQMCWLVFAWYFFSLLSHVKSAAGRLLGSEGQCVTCLTTRSSFTYLGYFVWWEWAFRFRIRPKWYRS